MAKKKNTSQSSQEFVKAVEAKLQGLHEDFKTAYTQGFTDGAVAERKRMAGLLTAGTALVAGTESVSVDQKSTEGDTSEKPAKKKRGSSWDNLSPEQRAERVAKLKESQKKRWAKTKAEAPAASDGTEDSSGSADAPVAESVG